MESQVITFAEIFEITYKAIGSIGLITLGLWLAYCFLGPLVGLE